MGQAFGVLLNKQVLYSITPHLYILMAQIVTEALFNTMGNKVASAVKLLVPVGFNAFRIPLLFLWYTGATEMVEASNAKFTFSVFAPFKTLFTSSNLLFLVPYYNYALSLANLIIWHVNLLYFLPFVVLPDYFDNKKHAQ